MRLEPGNPSPPTLELMPTLSLEPPGMPEHTKSSPWGKSLCPVLPHSVPPQAWACSLVCLPGTLTVTQGLAHVSTGG